MREVSTGGSVPGSIRKYSKSLSSVLTSDRSLGDGGVLGGVSPSCCRMVATSASRCGLPHRVVDRPHDALPVGFGVQGAKCRLQCADAAGIRIVGGRFDERSRRHAAGRHDGEGVINTPQVFDIRQMGELRVAEKRLQQRLDRIDRPPGQCQECRRTIGSGGAGAFNDRQQAFVGGRQGLPSCERNRARSRARPAVAPSGEVGAAGGGKEVEPASTNGGRRLVDDQFGAQVRNFIGGERQRIGERRRLQEAQIGSAQPAHKCRRIEIIAGNDLPAHALAIPHDGEA